LSLSYCEGWAGFAFAVVGHLGFDIEPAGSVSERAARRVMSRADLEDFDRLDAGCRLRVATRHWCCAEAVSKAAGEGLPMMLSRRMELRSARQGTWGRYRFAVGETDAGLSCALATDGPCELETALARVAVLDHR